MAFLIKQNDEILNQALAKVQRSTELTSTGPGSVLRSLVQAITEELGDMYSVLSFNMSQTVISTARGGSLDLIGELYSTKRKQLTEVATIDSEAGVFYFYIDAPYGSSITIPSGTRVFTDDNTTLGRQYTYITTRNVTIPVGRTKAFAPIRPLFGDSAFAAGKSRLVLHDFDEGAAGINVEVKCTNPKEIPSTVGYESDDSYRVRIIKEIRRSAGGTSEAVRFAALALQGVRDAKINTAPYGLGSFEVLVTPEDNRLAAGVIARAREAIEKVSPVGVRYFVKEPNYITVEIHANVVVNSRLAPDQYAAVGRRAEIGIIRYLNRLLTGEELVYHQLVQSIMEASEQITDVSFSQLSIMGSQVLRRNYTPEQDQQLIPGEIRVQIAS